MKRRGCLVAIFAVLGLGIAIQLSGYQVLYSRYRFTEHQFYVEGAAPVSVRGLYTCHYFAGLSFEYAVVPEGRLSWCRAVCRIVPGAPFRGMMQPGYEVARQPLCRS